MVGQIGVADKLPEEIAAPTRRDGPSERRAIGASTIGFLRAHPLLTVAVGASLVALAHAVWIWQHRHLGAYDPDEAGYLASSLRMERTLRSLDPLAFVRTVGTTGNGVTVPLLSVPFALVGPRDPGTVMLVQPALAVVTAVATTGITRRLAGPVAAVGAGMLVATLPTMATATQSYWYGLGSAACLAGAFWALLASERLTNRWTWWFGVGVGLMCLSRTMTLGYVPAAAGAGLVVAGWDRRRLLRLAASLGIAVAIAAPWYVVNARSIFGYLFSYGFGERAARFGSGGPLERLDFRMERYRIAIGDVTFPTLWVGALCVAVLVGWRAWRRRRASPAPARAATTAPAVAWRDGAAVAVALVLGTAALVSTTNNGVWFELPMVPLLVALLVSVIALGPWWFGACLAVPIALLSAAGLAQHLWLVPYGEPGPTAHYEHGFAQYDERFGPTARARHAEAAREWRDVSERVLGAIRTEVTGEDDPVVTLSGNMQLFNTNSLTLAGELRGWSPRLEVPDTAEPPERLAEHLTPTADHDGRTVPRVLLLAVHDRILFTPDEDVAAFARQAREAGWRVERRIPMPNGGEVQVLRHRSTRRAA